MHNRRWPVRHVALLVVFLSSFIASAQPDPPALQTITPDNFAQLVTLLRIDFGSASAMALAPDGSSLALAGTQGIWLYRADNINAPPRRLGDVAGVNTVAYHPAGHILASGDSDSNIIFWQLDDMRRMWQFEEHDAPVSIVRYHPDGDILASGDTSGTVRLWAATGGLPITSMAMHSAPVTSLAFSPDGRYLISGSDDGRLGFYDTERRIRMESSTDVGSPVLAVAFNPAADQVAVGTSTQALLVDMYTDAVTSLDIGSSEVRAIAYSPDGGMVATPDSLNSVSLWDTTTGEKTRWLVAQPDQNRGVGDPLGIAFSPDASQLFVLHEGSTVPNGQLISIWDVANEVLINQVSIGHLYFKDVIFSPEGRYMVAVGRPNIGKNVIHIWDARTFQEVVRLATPLGEDVIAFSRDGRYLASSGNVSITASPEERDAQNEIRIWDTDTWDVLGTLDGHSGFVQSLTFHPQYGNVLAAGTGVTTDNEMNGIYTWVLDTGEMLPPMEGHPTWVDGLRFAPDGSLLFSSGHESVSLWNWQNGQLVQNVPFEFTITGLALSPDGTQLAVANSAGAGVARELTPATAEYELLPGYVSTTPSTAVFNPSGTILALPDTDRGGILLFDLVNRRPAGVLQGHESTVYSVAFNPAGTVLASASADGTIRLWGVPSE